MLLPYFRAAQEQFEQFERGRHGRALCGKTRLEVVPWRKLAEEHGFTVRNFAATSEDGMLIVAAPELCELPESTVAAIVAHEFGHVYDFLRPAEFLVCDGELVDFHRLDAQGRDADKARAARARVWSERDDDHIEASADEIASLVLGQTIRYAGPCQLQTFDRGVKRPRGLR